MGAEITYALQNHSPDKPQAVRNSNQKLGHNLWINQDGEVVHSGAPAGNGGPGRFASADSLLSVPERGAPPHPNSPAARTIDPLIVSRYDALRTAPPRFVI